MFTCLAIVAQRLYRDTTKVHNYENNLIVKKEASFI